MMAIESDMITADVVEVNEFPEIAQRYSVYAVPKTVFNEGFAMEGGRPEQVFVEAVQQAGAGADTVDDE